MVAADDAVLRRTNLRISNHVTLAAPKENATSTSFGCITENRKIPRTYGTYRTASRFAMVANVTSHRARFRVRSVSNTDLRDEMFDQISAKFPTTRVANAIALASSAVCPQRRAKPNAASTARKTPVPAAIPATKVERQNSRAPALRGFLR